MKLYLNNIGKIKSAAIDLDGISVIAGENNTGKSTIGRALFSVFNSFYLISETIDDDKKRSVMRSVDAAYHIITDRFTSRLDLREIAEGIIANKDLYISDRVQLEKDILDYILRYDEYFQKFSDHPKMQELVDEIIEILTISDNEMLHRILSTKLDAEFAGQICNFRGSDRSSIKLQIRDENIVIGIADNFVDYISNSIELRTEAIYIDDPFVLDENRLVGRPRYSLYLNHREHLVRKIFSNQKDDENIIYDIVTNNKFNKIYSEINSVCSGEIAKKNNGSMSWGYKKDDRVYDFKNISAGIKTFAIIKKLLLNGVLEQNGTIILDEPEIHLHPEWQLVFAELIVLLQKEFGMHILLTTHSPYFLNAIEVYSKKHGIEEKCNYYLSEVENEVATIGCVNGDLEKIYYKLAYPLQRLEDEMYTND